MKTIETVGKDIEQALKNGLAELGCKLDDVDVKILEHPGIFRKARVRMTYNGDDGTVEKKTAASVMRNLEARAAKGAERSSRDDLRQKPENSKNRQASVNQRAPAQAGRPDENQAQRKPEKPRDNRPDQRQGRPASAAAAAVPEQKKPEFRRDFRAELTQAGNGAVRDNKAETARTEAKADRPARPERPARTEEPRQPVPPEVLEQAKEKAVAYLKDVSRLMGAESDCVCEIKDDEINVALTSESDVLIGYRGEAIEALEYLATIAANAGDNKAIRVNLDCGNYRAQRDAALAAMANTRADKAVSTGRRVELDPMSSASRRVVHAALGERDDVLTRSEGREPNRYIVIIPKRAQGERGQNGNEKRSNGNFNKNKKHWNNNGRKNFNNQGHDKGANGEQGPKGSDAE